MASATSLMAEEDFLCSICLVVFTQPVSIPCGHNFCLECITNYWDTVTVLKCPNCNDHFDTRPRLKVNTFIAGIAENFKRRMEKRCSSTAEQSEDENVLCGLCTGEKLAAVKSCLVCLMSFCQIHLEPHQTKSALKKHKLIPPAKNLESRICPDHDEPLDRFCTKDQMFLCAGCKDGKHKSHKVVSMEEEAELRKIQVGLQKEDTDQMIQAHQQKIVDVQCFLKASRNNAEDALSCSQDVMAAVVDYIKRSQVELTKVIEEKKKRNKKEAEVLILKVEEEMGKLIEENLQLDSVLLNTDPFLFLKNHLSLPISKPREKNWPDVPVEHGQFTIEEALKKLETTIIGEISMLCDPDFPEKQKHAVDITLDPDTANLNLNISDDLKKVAHSDRMKLAPNKPERFDIVPNVLAKEGFSSGRFYYEVQVKDKTQWDLGVANESINRKGDIRLSPKNGYWTIWLRRGSQFTANAGPAINLHVRATPQKIGVFVDYEDGQVSFYDVDARARIFSFTKCNFTEKLYPFFSPCPNDGGKNVAPLIITPVRHED